MSRIAAVRRSRTLTLGLVSMVGLACSGSGEGRSTAALTLGGGEDTTQGVGTGSTGESDGTGDAETTSSSSESGSNATTSDGSGETTDGLGKSCFSVVPGTENDIPWAEVEQECFAEDTAEACDLNANCTAIFGKPVNCTRDGICTQGEAAFLGCISFKICKPGAVVYCQTKNGYLFTYLGTQGDCVPPLYSECSWSGGSLIDEPAPPCP